jgi:hypothetical protein
MIPNYDYEIEKHYHPENFEVDWDEDLLNDPSEKEEDEYKK